MNTVCRPKMASSAVPTELPVSETAVETAPETAQDWHIIDITLAPGITIKTTTELYTWTDDLPPNLVWAEGPEHKFHHLDDLVLTNYGLRLVKTVKRGGYIMSPYLVVWQDLPHNPAYDTMLAFTNALLPTRDMVYEMRGTDLDTCREACRMRFLANIQAQREAAKNCLHDPFMSADGGMSLDGHKHIDDWRARDEFDAVWAHRYRDLAEGRYVVKGVNMVGLPKDKR